MEFPIEDLLNFIYLLYDALRKGIQVILEATIIKASPILAEKYADAISLLITITSIWLLLEFSTGVKKIVRAIVILGWVLLMVSILISILG